MQQKLWLNRGQGQIWTWIKLDRRWWNAPLQLETITVTDRDGPVSLYI